MIIDHVCKTEIVPLVVLVLDFSLDRRTGKKHRVLSNVNGMDQRNALVFI